MKVFYLLFFLSVSVCYSQEIQPRAYANIPKNLDILGLAYSYSSGNVVANATSPIQDLELNTNSIAPAYVRTFSMFKKLARIQVITPYAFLGGTAKLKGKDTSASRSGFTDAAVKFGWNFLGSEALDLKGFSLFKQSTILGASIAISVPIGQYYQEKLINLGSNRWGFKPEIGFSLREKEWYFETYTGVWFFTDNTKYLNTNTLKQKPLFNLQGHVSYTFKKYILISASLGYVYGGQTTVNDTERDDLQNNKRLGISLSVPFSMALSAKLQYNSGIYTRVGGDFKIFTLSLQYILL